MNTMILLNIFLIIHLTGLALVAGTTVVDTVTFRFFSKSFEKERERSLNLLALMEKLDALLGIGVALLILSGTGLLIITHGAFFHQTWFKIKLVLILTLILNGFIVGGRQKSKLKTSINENSPAFDIQTNQAIRNIKMFYLAQMSLLLTIIFLSVFKYN
jgi:uncharacterized membrane protein SirB2